MVLHKYFSWGIYASAFLLYIILDALYKKQKTLEIFI